MPGIENVRRSIGRDIIQKYVTDGGEDMIDSNDFVSDGTLTNYNVGFRPKMVLVSIDDTTKSRTSIFTENGYMNIYDYDILDYENRIRTVAKQRVYPTPSNDITFTETGFNLIADIGNGFYIAIG